MTRDGLEQRLACMQMALLLRADGRFFLTRRRDHNGNDLGEYLGGCGPEHQQRAEDMAPRVPQFQAHRHGQGVPGAAAASTRAVWT